MPTVGIVQTVYKRPHLFAAQRLALLGQSVRPSQSVVWVNANPGNEELAIDDDMPTGFFAASPNAGVWPRFRAGLDLQTDFVAIFDDDTIPGSRWLEHCLASFEKQKGLIGAAGVIFPGGKREPRWYARANRFQVRDAYPLIPCDIVGHCWFCPTDWLRYFAGEARTSQFDTCGEDYHLAWAVQKYVGVGCYVPEVPEDRAFWGTLKPELGSDDVALYRQPGEEKKKAEAHAKLVKAGWHTLWHFQHRHDEFVSPTFDEDQENYVADLHARLRERSGAD